ncbi:MULTISPECIES: hypothetical protein [Neobacillus]|uniref:Uncharacterized protein n=1 Tax=Neobacillus citreus TaxID=2833578 RepID=A0A942SUI1_9BACI|nr:hypothetical protein [Neobacillus citreus]MCH6265482.1 hypothetical protein [Neobacillus citreus]
MKIKTYLTACGLLITIGLGAYLDSPYSFINKKLSYTADQPVHAVQASVEPPEDMPEMVEKLVKREKKDGYILETYQEYEVYKDEDGNISEEVPTSKTEILKYYDYRNKDR